MVRFFLHIWDVGELLRDIEGLDCEGPAEARLEAIRVISELLRDGAWSTEVHPGRLINIVDGAGTLVDVVSLWQVLERETVSKNQPATRPKTQTCF